MGKKDFISGSVLEFKLPIDLGYAYCKVLDFRNIREFDGVLVKVYDHIVQAPVSDVAELKFVDWLFGARRMPCLPGTRGKGAWRIKGVLISEDDRLIPDFKYSIQANAFEADLSKLSKWNIVKNIREYKEADYECVKHLEDTVLSPRPAIEKRTAMEYCRIHNLDVGKLFNLEEPVNKIVYNQMINVPVYSEIPQKFRGKGAKKP